MGQFQLRFFRIDRPERTQWLFRMLRSSADVQRRLLPTLSLLSIVMNDLSRSLAMTLFLCTAARARLPVDTTRRIVPDGLTTCKQPETAWSTHLVTLFRKQHALLSNWPSYWICFQNKTNKEPNRIERIFRL